MMMLHCGWELQELNSNAYFSKDAEKEFTILAPGAGSFHRSYLQVLLQADWLFEAEKNVHFPLPIQSENYDCILSLAKMGAADDLGRISRYLKPHRLQNTNRLFVKMFRRKLAESGRISFPWGTADRRVHWS